MLPNLGQLALHDEAETGGFYELSAAEQANMNDDPVTLEKPVYTMSFRVRLPQDNADGSPRYKFFAPLELWTWVKANQTLPAREGPVWYEDWWALCNTYNPTHQNIPAWAHRLERYDQYAARMAREAAERAQQEARERARAAREAEEAAAARQREQEVAARAAERAREVAEGVRAAGARNAAADAPGDDDLGFGPPGNNNRRTLPRLRAGEVRRGAQRATDKLISWRFWLQGTRDEGRMQSAFDFMRTRFGAFMRAHFSREAVDDWSSRLLLSVGVRDLMLVPDGATFPALWIDCHVFVPPPYAGSFEALVTDEMSEWNYGVGSAMRRMFGVIGAWSRGPQDPTDGVFNRGSWRDLPDAPVQTLTPPTVTRVQYIRWHDWATDDEPMRIVPGQPGPQAETDWAVDWRFWLKGKLPEEYLFMRFRIREWFRLHMRAFNNSPRDYGERLHLHMVERTLMLAGAPLDSRRAFVIQVDVQVYMPSRVFADDFVRTINHLSTPESGPGHSFEHAMHVLFGIKSAMKWAAADKPVVRDKPNDRLTRSKRMGPNPVEVPVKPVLNHDQYVAWDDFSHVPYNSDQRYAMGRDVRVGGETRVRWRFWLKGEMTEQQKVANAIWMRRNFASYMAQNPVPRRFYYGEGYFDDGIRWFRRTRATIIQEPHPITNEQGSSFTVYPLRCEFEIYFDRPRASAFQQWVSSTIGTGSWEALAEEWVGFKTIRAWDGWDKPQQLDNEDPHDDTHDLMTEIPTDTVHAWNQWVGWRRVRRAAA